MLTVNAGQSTPSIPFIVNTTSYNAQNFNYMVDFQFICTPKAMHPNLLPYNAQRR